MNRGLAENEFRRGLEKLLEDIEGEQTRPTINPYAGASEDAFHEHDTRIFFFDQLLRLLGWDRSAGGNVVEEARIKAESTRFIDYLGVKANPNIPIFILEAKAWEKPLISGKGKWAGAKTIDLVIAALQHLHGGGTKEASPVTGEWHDYLAQLRGYVRTSKENYGHDVLRAVLSSGKWLLIFKAPVAAFCGGALDDKQFLLLESKDYVAQAHEIYNLLAREMLVLTPPERIRSTQLPSYVNKDRLKAVYHALLIKYEESGSPLFALSPRILLYPALLVERTDQMLFPVIDTEDPFHLPSLRFGDGREALTAHFAEVVACAQELLKSCSEALRCEIVASPLKEFHGFEDGSRVDESRITLATGQKILIRPMRMISDHWLAGVGTNAHYLLEMPHLDCHFHQWEACRAASCEFGTSAINIPATSTPRSFFIDAAPHHCANRDIIERRHNRCHLAPFDYRICCKACVYHDLCWSEDERGSLPCGA